MDSKNSSIKPNPKGIRNERTRKMVLLAMLSALTLILSVVPYLGYITIGPFSMVTIHIPVIIGAIILGPEAGAFLGLIFGTVSLIEAPMVQPLTAFIFSPFVPYGNGFSAVIAIVPRVMIGIVAAYLYKFISLRDKKGFIASLAAGIGGALTNTILVLGGVYIFFGQRYAATLKIPYGGLIKGLLAVVATNGIFEAVVAAIVVTAVTRALFAAKKRI